MGALTAGAASCAGTAHLVMLGRDVTGARAQPPATTLEILSASTAVADPLRVRGSSVAYGGLEGALGRSIALATEAWAAARHLDPIARRGGWTLALELTRADAELEEGQRLVVGIEVRATLRAREGNVYLGQTQTGCREAGLVAPGDGAPVIDRCMTRIGRDLAGWLDGGVSLEPPAPPSG
jgi:hypothetical protein